MSGPVRGGRSGRGACSGARGAAAGGSGVAHWGGHPAFWERGGLGGRRSGRRRRRRAAYGQMQLASVQPHAGRRRAAHHSQIGRIFPLRHAGDRVRVVVPPRPPRIGRRHPAIPEIGCHDWRGAGCSARRGNGVDTTRSSRVADHAVRVEQRACKLRSPATNSPNLHATARASPCSAPWSASQVGGERSTQISLPSLHRRSPSR